jgi:hypothetical protein
VPFRRIGPRAREWSSVGLGQQERRIGILAKDLFYGVSAARGAQQFYLSVATKDKQEETHGKLRTME